MANIMDSMYKDEEETREVDGLVYKEEGPYCVNCGHHMGDLYCGDLDIPHDKCIISGCCYESYDDVTCCKCGQQYQYIEGTVPVIDDSQVKL